MMDEKLKRALAQFQPTVQASLDSICIINKKGQIVYLNLAMKTFLNLPARELKKLPVFCDVIKMAACERGCQINEVLNTGEALRLDEAPAMRGNEKMRVLLKVSPLYDPESPKDQGPVGAIMNLRDTTGEVLLQAKYHKLIQLIADKDAKIAALEERLNTLRDAMRKARHNAAA